MAKKKQRQTRVCMVCTVYALFEYLLYSSYEEIKNTYFILEEFLFKEFGNKFEHSFCVPGRGYGDRWRNVVWPYYYFMKWFRLPRLKDKELFVQDHLPYHAIFIGKHKYTLVEDCPYIHSLMLKNNFLFSTCEEQEYEKLPYGKGKLAFQFRKKVYGPVYFNRWGKNRICTDLLLSTDDHLDYFDSKTIHHINTKGIWDTFSLQKQELILNVFDMNQEDVELLRSKRIIILTQPLYPDHIGIEEHGDIWKKIISKYPINDVIIKPHPRDLYDYEKDFDGLTVFRKKAPSQFFDVLDLKFDKAVTAFSSAVFGLDAKEIDWYGTEVSETIHNKLDSKKIIPNIDSFKVNYCKI